MENKKDLKIRALEEAFANKVSSMVLDYENRIADLRVELTLLNEEVERLRIERDNVDQAQPEES